MRRINLCLLVFSLLLYNNVFSQSDIIIDVLVHNHHTYAPLDSALVTVFQKGILVDSSYTGTDGKAQLSLTTTRVEEMQQGIPNTFVVSENYPNPFRDETRVNFSVPELQTVRAEIYNILGQRVMSDEITLSPGYYSINLSLSYLSTGIYFLHFRGLEQQTIKLTKVGGDVIGGIGRGSTKATSHSGIGLSMLKPSREFTEFTIRVEKDWYESRSVTKHFESDTTINIPLVLLAEYLLTDIDDNEYQTVKIGDQWWMAENLKTTRYRNGDAIPANLDNAQWQNTTSDAYAVYPHGDVDGINSEEEMVDAYGKLYNWYAVDDERGLCPTGWHIPSDDEWKQLEMYLGMTREDADNPGSISRGIDEGGKMKSIRTEPDTHPRWDSPNEGVTNESGFSGLPCLVPDPVLP